MQLRRSAERLFVVVAAIALPAAMLCPAGASAELVNYWDHYVSVTGSTDWGPWSPGSQTWTGTWTITNSTTDVVLSELKVFEVGVGVSHAWFPYVSQGHWQDAAGNTGEVSSPITGYELYPRDLLWPHWTQEWLATYREDIPYPYVYVGTLNPGESAVVTTAFSVNLVSSPSYKEYGLDGFANATVIPEPSTLVVLASGTLGVMAIVALRRRLARK